MIKASTCTKMDAGGNGGFAPSLSLGSWRHFVELGAGKGKTLAARHTHRNTHRKTLSACAFETERKTVVLKKHLFKYDLCSVCVMVIKCGLKRDASILGENLHKIHTCKLLHSGWGCGPETNVPSVPPTWFNMLFCWSKHLLWICACQEIKWLVSFRLNDSICINRNACVGGLLTLYSPNNTPLLVNQLGGGKSY